MSCPCPLNIEIWSYACCGHNYWRKAFVKWRTWRFFWREVFWKYLFKLCSAVTHQTGTGNILLIIWFNMSFGAECRYVFLEMAVFKEKKNFLYNTVSYLGFKILDIDSGLCSSLTQCFRPRSLAWWWQVLPRPRSSPPSVRSQRNDPRAADQQEDWTFFFTRIST